MINLRVFATVTNRELYYQATVYQLTGRWFYGHALPPLPPVPAGRIAPGGIMYRAGVHEHGRSPLDGGVRWAVFSRRDISPDGAVELLGWCHFYSGPGMFFTEAPFARVGGSRVLVTQRYGYDC